MRPLGNDLELKRAEFKTSAVPNIIFINILRMRAQTKNFKLLKCEIMIDFIVYFSKAMNDK